MANTIDDDDDRLINAEDSCTDDDQQEGILSLPSVVGSGQRKVKKSNMKRNKLVTVQPGLILLSGLPYGFFERELYSYFSQFGVVTRLKLIRSKKTGGSRGYAYVEFEDEDVARIASETMNGYLMFRSLIKSHLIDRSKVDTEKLFKNWKRLPIVKTSRQKRALHNRIKSSKQIKRSNQRRSRKLLKKQEKLAAAGVIYELTDFIPLDTAKKSEEKSPERRNKTTANKKDSTEGSMKQ